MHPVSKGLTASSSLLKLIKNPNQILAMVRKFRLMSKSIERYHINTSLGYMSQVFSCFPKPLR